MKTISLIVLFALIGLIVGYFLFGKQGGSYVQVTRLLETPRTGIGSAWQKVTGMEKIRQNILIAGGVGALAGLVMSVAGRRSGR